jgi:small subunit ribosomal protein S9
MAEPTTTKTKNDFYGAVGRRKSSIVTVRLTAGKGVFTVNGDTKLEDYFATRTQVDLVQQPLKLVGKLKDVDVNLQAHGGGKAGQADAAVLAIARALTEMGPDFRTSLKKAGFLTRDPREKERKKYGLKKARKAPQFSKR